MCPGVMVLLVLAYIAIVLIMSTKRPVCEALAWPVSLPYRTIEFIIVKIAKSRRLRK